MSLDISFHEEAQVEFDEAVAFYAMVSAFPWGRDSFRRWSMQLGTRSGIPLQPQ